MGIQTGSLGLSLTDAPANRCTGEAAAIVIGRRFATICHRVSSGLPESAARNSSHEAAKVVARMAKSYVRSCYGQCIFEDHLDGRTDGHQRGRAGGYAAAKTAPPQEPIGFVTGGVIGGFAAGPVGAVIGAGIGTWLGQRVHRAGEATKAEAKVAALESDKSQLQSKTAASKARPAIWRRPTAPSPRGSMNFPTAWRKRKAPRTTPQRENAAKVLDGLQGEVLFRTGSAEITPETAHGIQLLAGAVRNHPALQVRIDGYADPRGTVDTNLKFSEQRANAVRDLFLAAGIDDEALEVNAYGKSQSVAADNDGYALERRVRLTLQAAGPAPGRPGRRSNFERPFGGGYPPNERKAVIRGGSASSASGRSCFPQPPHSLR